MQDETNTRIDIDEDGTVYISSTDGVGFDEAKERILGMVEVPEIGHIYTGKCVRVTDFGAFIEILPGIDGMVHISQLASSRVNKVEDVVKVGDELTVMVTDISPDGKVRLSRVALLEGWTPEEAREHDNPNRKKSSGSSGHGGSSRGGGRSSNRGDQRDRR